MSWGKPFYDFQQRQDPKDYPDYIIPFGGRTKDYPTLKYRCESTVSNQDLALNDGKVPTDHWLVLIGSTIIGTAKTRYILDQVLVHEGGHIRLGLAPEYRGQGYGREALELLLEECRHNHNLYDVMLTAQDFNEAAIGLIKACGGSWVAEVDNLFRRGLTEVYWVRYPVPSRV